MKTFDKLGNWKVNDQRHSGWMDNSVYISNPNNIAKIYKDESGGEENQMDYARLIAIAPEMYRLLKKSIQSPFQFNYLIAEALIQRIEGENENKI